LLAQLWRSRVQEEDVDEDSSYFTDLKDKMSEGYNKAGDLYSRAKGATLDAGLHAAKKRFLPHEEHSMFDDTSKKIQEIYRSAVSKAHKSTSDLPTAGETWEMTKRKAREAYDEVLHKAHGESRSRFQQLRDKIGHGFSAVGSTGVGFITKTWHLALHSMLALFWITLGAIGCVFLQGFINRQTFNKQLSSNIVGPVIMNKEFMVVGTEDTQRKFQDYWTNTAASFFQRQQGLRKFTLQRGFNVGSNVWQHMTEWNSIDDLRRALAQPELQDIKKRMPGGTINKRSISQVVTTGKGNAFGTTTGGPIEGDVIRAEGLRQRTGPGAQQTVVS